jgi:hypothetical protein
MTITASLDMARKSVEAAETAEAAAEAASRLATAEREAGRATRGDEQAAKRKHMQAIDATEDARQRLRKVEAAQSSAQHAQAAAAADQRNEVKRRASELEAEIGRVLGAFDQQLTAIEVRCAALNAEYRGLAQYAIGPPSAYRQAFQFLTTGLANLRANFPTPPAPQEN